jgi:enolase
VLIVEELSAIEILDSRAHPTLAVRVCREAAWAQMVSHRSGETEDTLIAKYNRLIEIEAREHLRYGVAGRASD